jgi:uncharacterized membrane protein
MIDANNSLLLLACLFSIVVIGYECEKTAWGSKVSAPLIILLLSFILGNLNILPSSADVYITIQSILVPLAIPLLLFSANVQQAFKESGYMLLAFSLTVAFTVAGALIGASFVNMGDSEGALVGILVASYTGGSANFVSVSQALGFSDSSLYASALTADAIGAIFFLILLMLLPSINFVINRLPLKTPSTNNTMSKISPTSTVATESGMLKGMALSAIICAIGLFIASLVPWQGVFIISITLLSLAAANFTPKLIKSNINFDFQLGTLFMYIFFATIGVGANLSSMVDTAIPIVIFLVILVIVHIVLLVWVGAWFKLDLAELMIASSACILGPSAAAAIAASKGWNHLVTPGMLVGVLGYAIGTFLGVALAYLLS